jgi:hypothetical protein
VPKFFVSFTDQRKPQKVKREEIAVDATLSGEAIEKANTIFFTKHSGERHADFEIRCTNFPQS